MTKSFFSYSNKSSALNKISGHSDLQLFAQDVSSVCGAKAFISSTKEIIFNMIYDNGVINSFNNFFYDYIEHDTPVSLTIDFDIKDLDGALGVGCDTSQIVIDIIRQVNDFLNSHVAVSITIEDWIITSSGYYAPEDKTPKYSWHAKLTGHMFKNIREVRDLMFAIDLNDPYSAVDLSPYKAGAMRLTGCSKKGRKLPLLPIEITDERGLTSLTPDDYLSFYDYWCDSMMTKVEDYQMIALPDHLKLPSVDRIRHHNLDLVNAEIIDRVDRGELPELEVLTGLIDCLNETRAQSYQPWFEVCMAIINSCTSSTERILYDSFEKFSQKNPEKFNEKYSTATFWESSKKNVKDYSFTCGSLFHWAKEDDRESYKWLIKTVYLPPILLKEFIPDYSKFAKVIKVQGENGLIEYKRTRPLNDDDDIFDYYEYQSKHCDPIPFQQYPGVLLVAGCGKGKSHAVRIMLTEEDFERILKISVRILYTKECVTKLRELGLNVECYLGKEREPDLSGYSIFVISPESCWRISWNRKYDFVDFDEIESILRSLSSEKTMHNLPGSAAALVDFLNEAAFFLTADAHTSNRTLDFIRAVHSRSNKRFLIMRNTMPAVNRTVKHYVQQSNSPADVTKHQDYFIDLIIKDIRQGKDVGVHSNSKGFADRLVMAIQDEDVLKADELLYFYGEQGIEGDIEDLNSAMDDKRLVIWTPAMTIGNSYDRRVKFHCQYAYLTCKSTNACVAVQACQRIRDWKENTLHLMIDEVPNQSCKLTFDDVKLSLEDKREEIINTYRKELERHAVVTRDEFFDLKEKYKDDANKLMEMMENIIKRKMWSPALHTPEILFNSLVWNRLENNLSIIHYTSILYFYLKQEGYLRFDRIPVHLKKDEIDSDKPKRRGKRDMPRLLFAEIADLNHDEYEKIDNLKRKGKHTQEQLAALEKYLFVDRLIQKHHVSIGDQAALFDDFRVNREHKTWLFNAYNICRRDASEVMFRNIEKIPYLEVTRPDGAIQCHMEKIIHILGLSCIHDTTKVIDRRTIEENLSCLCKYLQALRSLMSKAPMKEDFRSVSECLKTFLKELYGLKIVNLDQGKMTLRKDSSQKKQVSYQLQFSDDFAKRLYTCGLLR